jgi:mannose-6-phosphate isomerase
MHRIKGRIQHYAWGGKTFIPELLTQENSGDLPCGEYWLGTHPGGPSTVLLSENALTTLPALINSDKNRYLGKSVMEQFHSLPFLFKILDVKDMLSIQVHPTKAAAEEGFRRENEMGIPLAAPNRNYKDENYKPEVMVALSDFWLLHGFANDIQMRVKQYEILKPFQPDYESGGIKGLYKKLMELNSGEVDAIIAPLSERIIPLYKDNKIDKSAPDYWAAKAMLNFENENGHFDKGIFSIYLFNILNLHPGQGIFQGAGMPHAYLEGQNIELMSNSDNVLRAGLTPKYIDIPELLANTNFVPTIPQIIEGDLNAKHQVYDCPVPDFILYANYIKAGVKQEIRIEKPAIILVMSGNAVWRSNSLFKTTGADSLFVASGETIQIEAETDTMFFLATVPA